MFSKLDMYNAFSTNDTFNLTMDGFIRTLAFPGGSVVKNPPAKQETGVLSLGQDNPPGEGNGNPLQHCCRKNPMDRGTWEATIHKIARVRYNLTTNQQQQFHH